MNRIIQDDQVILNIDLPIFCKTMVEAAVGWLRHHAADPNVLRNLAEVVRRYPDGGRFISGVPVIM